MIDGLVSGPLGLRTLCGVPEGYDALMLAKLAQQSGTLLHIGRDDARLARLADTLAFFAPHCEVLTFPAWDCVPYDRVSPHVEIVARRMETLSRLSTENSANSAPKIVLTTVSAALQRVPTTSSISAVSFPLEVGKTLDLALLQDFLSRNGYGRADTVMEAGEYALRGGIVDVFPPGRAEPLRLDLFGDLLEQMRSFEPMSQRSTGRCQHALLRPASEIMLDDEAIQRFRAGYRELFGPVEKSDPLYEAISAGMPYPGMEHWLPLFHDGLDTIFAYLPAALVTLDHQVDDARKARFDQILEYYQARQSVRGHGIGESGMIYNPLPPGLLHLEAEEWTRILAGRRVIALWPFPKAEGVDGAFDAGGRAGRDFADLRIAPGVNLYDGVRDHIVSEIQARRR
ncbi:MAG TPA: transcription-repair coupling factor, partial [Rhodospirillaceae bacterium]|nr:transcription-repair coupling factor [Rhodospirillaceae bacterium]